MAWWIYVIKMTMQRSACLRILQVLSAKEFNPNNNNNKKRVTLGTVCIDLCMLNCTMYTFRRASERADTKPLNQSNRDILEKHSQRK